MIEGMARLEGFFFIGGRFFFPNLKNHQKNHSHLNKKKIKLIFLLDFKHKGKKIKLVTMATSLCNSVFFFVPVSQKELSPVDI